MDRRLRISSPSVALRRAPSDAREPSRSVKKRKERNERSDTQLIYTIGNTWTVSRAPSPRTGKGAVERGRGAERGSRRRPHAAPPRVINTLSAIIRTHSLPRTRTIATAIENKERRSRDAHTRARARARSPRAVARCTAARRCPAARRGSVCAAGRAEACSSVAWRWY